VAAKVEEADSGVHTVKEAEIAEALDINEKAAISKVRKHKWSAIIVTSPAKR